MAIFFSGRQLRQLAHFPDAVGQRLFQIDVFAALHGRPGRMKMIMVGRADYDAVDPRFHLVEHLAEVEELFRLRKFLIGLSRTFVVDVAKSDDILTADLLEIHRALAAETDHRQIELVVGRHDAVGASARSEPKAGAESAGGF